MESIYSVSGRKVKFEDLLRKNGITDDNTRILKKNGIVDTKVLVLLENDDMIGLGFNLGQRKLLWKLVEKLKSSAGEETESKWDSSENKNSDRWHGNSVGKDEIKEIHTKTKEMLKTGVIIALEKLDYMNEENFWCLFWRLGGFAAVGIGGILALIALVKFAPFAVAGAVGLALIAALISSIWSLYYSQNAKPSVTEDVLRSVEALGITWKNILFALFGKEVVIKAVLGMCGHCFDK